VFQEPFIKRRRGGFLESGLELDRVAVMRAGEMGHGAGQPFHQGGLEARLLDKHPEALQKAKARIEGALQKLVGRQKIAKKKGITVGIASVIEGPEEDTSSFFRKRGQDLRGD
jgi:3-hydroxyacyl-CoA dehydrogenase, NAD binding domain